MNFDLYFGQNSNKKTTLTEAQIAQGFEFLGQTPPSRYDFDFVFRRIDMKCKDIYEKYLEKDNISSQINTVVNNFNSTKSKIDNVEKTKNDALSIGDFMTNDYYNYEWQNSMVTNGIQQYQQQVWDLTSAVSQLSNEIMQLLNTDYGNDITGLMTTLNQKKVQLQDLVDQLEAMSGGGGNVDIVGYLGKNMNVYQGDTYNIAGIPRIYKCICTQGGNTGNEDFTILPNNIKDGYTFTRGTATFILFLSFLSAPIVGNIDVVCGGNFNIDAQGFLINPYDNTRLEHRKTLKFDTMETIAEYSRLGNNINYAQHDWNKNLNKNYLVKSGLDLHYMNRHGDLNSAFGYGFSYYNDANYNTSALMSAMMHKHGINLTTSEFVDAGNHMHSVGISARGKTSSDSASLDHNYSSTLIWGESAGTHTTLSTTTKNDGGHSHQISSYTDYNKPYNIDNYGSMLFSTDNIPESMNLIVVEYI